MQKLLNSILRNGTLLLFIFLFGLTLLFISKHQRYQRSKFLAFNNMVTAPFFTARNELFSYVKLRGYNQQLLKENQYLIEQLTTTQNRALLLDSLPFKVIPAQVIRNSTQLNYNFITLNKGSADGIQNEMGIITSRGVVGIVNNTNNKVSGVISLLNKSFRINAKLKTSNHFGSLYWDGDSPFKMALSDIRLAANISVGDTIETGGMSAVFPAGIVLGVVSKIEVPINDNYYNLTVSLSEDLTNLNYVYAVVFPSAALIQEMKKESTDE